MKGIIDGVVRSPQLRHSRVGGNDGIVQNLGFYDAIIINNL